MVFRLNHDSALYIVVFTAVMLTLIPGFIQPASALEITPETQFQFASNYFEKGDYYRAISEFNRFLFHFPGHKNVRNARYQIGLSHFQLKDYDKAFQAFSSVLENTAGLELSELEADAYFMAVDCRLKLESRESAVKMLEQLIEVSPQSAVRDRARYKLVWMHIESGMWEAAHEVCGRMTGEQRKAYHIGPLEKEVLKARFMARKSGWIAGGLSSVIPGLGYVYTNRYRDALTAFLLNSALILAARESFEEGHEALGGVFAAIELGFYSGTLIGSVHAADAYNKNKTRDVIKSLKGRFQLIVSGTGSGNEVRAIFSQPF